MICLRNLSTVSHCACQFCKVAAVESEDQRLMLNKGIEKATGSATIRLGVREVKELAYAAFISDREKSIGFEL
jgi:hypothetical protein